MTILSAPPYAQFTELSAPYDTTLAFALALLLAGLLTVAISHKTPALQKPLLTLLALGIAFGLLRASDSNKPPLPPTPPIELPTIIETLPRTDPHEFTPISFYSTNHIMEAQTWE